MPKLSQHQSNQFTKMLLEGDSGSGKTGSLTSLVAADYRLRVLDMDNGLESLKQFVLRECPEKVDNIDFRTLRDVRKATAEGPQVLSPKAFIEAIKMLDHWKYKEANGDEVDLGKPSEWGPDYILVVDSLTFLSDAAWDFRLNIASSTAKDKYDMRAVYKDAQDAIESTLAMLTGESFRTNVIVISHIKYVDNPDGTKKGYPTSIGSALSPLIPRYFNSVALCETGNGGKRSIRTVATAMIDLKNPKPFAMADKYPIDTGLADFFAVLRNQGGTVVEKPEVVKPTLLKRRV